MKKMQIVFVEQFDEILKWESDQSPLRGLEIVRTTTEPTRFEYGELVLSKLGLEGIARMRTDDPLQYSRLFKEISELNELIKLEERLDRRDGLGNRGWAFNLNERIARKFVGIVLDGPKIGRCAKWASYTDLMHEHFASYPLMNFGHLLVGFKVPKPSRAQEA